ncbi:GNAT family N-acetyltransferase [Phytomonospora endophytica]|uniref:Putative acetyltransferase n=1 Tax=Phytomonospora endophytica TaxID=714109 RepID=A0A841FPT5_9ACTN|nr:N-acetyltransferase [Phytomonospora endophytica]MBB6035808.1 putative acetyltransferase [Phytomonospora endophytica]GIG71450.1 N-acetyltransferase [Phytomonospora endophytica]
MIIRRETPEDHRTVHAVHVEAFGRDLEADLLDRLRGDESWIPELSLVAADGDHVVGHVVCTKATVGGAHTVLGLGPIAVDPSRQGARVGSLLVHTAVATADVLGYPLIVLLGDPAFYRRFGFVLAHTLDVHPAFDEWRHAFQARTLSAYTPEVRGPFAYATPFNDLPTEG